MKWLLMMIACFACRLLVGGNPPAAELRRLYSTAALQQDSALKLTGLLKPVDNADAPLLVCYKGAADIVAAKYAGNPFVKLNKVKAGRALMESAINRDTADVEMRYLRFTIQTNLPAFLNYHSNIVTDKFFLLNRFGGINDAELKILVTGFLAGSKYCTDDELKERQIERKRNIDR